MVPVPQRKDIKEICVVSADVESEDRIDLEAPVKSVSTHKLGLRLPVNRNKMETADVTFKVYQSNSVAKTVCTETLLERFQFKSHRGQKGPCRYIPGLLQEAQQLIAVVRAVFDSLYCLAVLKRTFVLKVWHTRAAIGEASSILISYHPAMWDFGVPKADY